MMTVSQLAKRSGLSRTAILYYERSGLLKPALRTSSNYRAYGEEEVKRLEQICLYRSVGVGVRDIRLMLSAPESKVASLLKRRLQELEREIVQLRGHQHLILKLLRGKNLRRKNMTKEKWVSIMKAAGFTEADMQRWHRTFERSSPQEHEKFLEYLHIPDAEIRSIRKWSANADEN
jgi:MerR family transcriptional regulator, thiopeptide resistance regulator